MLEKPPGATPLLLRAVQREIGVPHQLQGMRAVVRRNRDADADTDIGLVALQVIGLADHLDDTPCEHGGVHRTRNTQLQDRELIPAETRHRVAFAYGIHQARCDSAQQSVAHGMPQRIVDRLEAVKVEAQQRKSLAPLCHRQRLLQPFLEQRPVCQSGQDIVAGEEGDLRFGFPAARDVLMRCNPAAIRHRLVIDGNGPSVFQLDDGVMRFVAARDRIARLQVVADRRLWEAAGVEAKLGNLRQGDAGPDRIGRDMIKFRVPTVANDQFLIATEEANALGEVGQGGIHLLAHRFQCAVIGRRQLVRPFQPAELVAEQPQQPDHAQ